MEHVGQEEGAPQKLGGREPEARGPGQQREAAGSKTTGVVTICP